MNKPRLKPKNGSKWVQKCQKIPENFLVSYLIFLGTSRNSVSDIFVHRRHGNFVTYNISHICPIIKFFSRVYECYPFSDVFALGYFFVIFVLTKLKNIEYLKTSDDFDVIEFLSLIFPISFIIFEPRTYI